MIGIISSSCQKENSECCTVVSASFSFNIVNDEDDDLLDTNSYGSFPIEKMKLYYIIEDEKIEVYDVNMDSPRNIGLNTESSPISLWVGFHTGQQGFTHEEQGLRIGTSIALIELNEFITDTIVAEWSAWENGNFVVYNIWYNGEEHSPNEVFQVIKEN